MTVEKPQIRPDIQFRQNFSLPVLSPVFGNLDDPVKHQHGGQGQPGIARAEQLPMRALQQIFVCVTVFPVQNLYDPAWSPTRDPEQPPVSRAAAAPALERSPSDTGPRPTSRRAQLPARKSPMARTASPTNSTALKEFVSPPREHGQLAPGTRCSSFSNLYMNRIGKRRVPGATENYIQNLTLGGGK